MLLGDILVGIDGQPVNDTDDLQALLMSDRAGKTVPVEVIRGGTLQTLQVTVGQR
jgi:S1-C subfamily serine protease